MSRGGPRKGAGRPKGSGKPKTTRVTVRLTDAELMILDAVGASRQEAIRKLIGATVREWMAVEK